MFKYLTCVALLLLCCLLSLGNNIEIRYHEPQATQVTMIWGVNDWNITENKPAGTIISNNVMHSPMTKEGEYYILKIVVPDSSSIDYLFQFNRKAGLFKITFSYLDVNEQPDKKFYHSVINENTIITLRPDLSKVKLVTEIPLLIYSAFFFLAFSIIALILFAREKFIFKTTSTPLKPAYLFFAISLTLLFILIVIRAIITNVAIRFLIDPWYALPLLFKISLQDFLYICMVTILFAFFFFIKKNQRTLILWIFSGFAVLSILVCMANIKITALLGRPFTYQWLYYSDFLNSTDAIRAISANIEKQFLGAYLLMILAAIPLGWIIYQLSIKKPILAISIFTACLGLGFFAKNDLSIHNVKRENPVIYFLSSLAQQNVLSTLSTKKNTDQHEFMVKNKNVVHPQFAARFSEANIKNVIVFVLESTPAEYITPYNPRYKVTPFLDSIKSSAELFDAIYAHAPATNKSLVSILCGVYPYLSYKSITAEMPGIGWPSISSELKKNGYRTSFFNSGDNRFQGAEIFLQHREFDVIQDFRQTSCDATTFSDKRYLNKNLEGTQDSCLQVKFFNWLKGNESMPFFSMMWTYQTHYPYFSTGNKIDFHSNNVSQEKYLNALHHADKTLQQLVEGLEKRHLLKSTLIVVVGDHGEAFGRHGQTTHAGGIFEENLHIPLILINPVLFTGEHISEIGGISDVAPTIFSILNKPISDEWQGENLFSMNRRNKVYFFSPYSDYLFGLREGNYKFIYNATTNVSALYNLKTDPFESVNIANEHPQYIKEMTKKLNGWIQYQSEYVNSFLK